MKKWYLSTALFFILFLAFPAQAGLNQYLTKNRILDGFWNDTGTRLVTITENRIDTWRIEKKKAVRVGTIDEAKSRTEVFRGKNARFLTDTGRPWAGKNYNLTLSWDGQYWAYIPPPRAKDPNRKTIVVNRFDHTYQPGDTSGHAVMLPLPTGRVGKIYLAFSPDGKELAACMAVKKKYDFFLFIWSLDSGHILKKVRLFQPEGKNQLLDYNLVKWNNEEKIGIPKGWLSYSPDGRYLVTGGRGMFKKYFDDGGGYWADNLQDVRIVLDRATLDPVWFDSEKKYPEYVAFSRDGRIAFVSYWNDDHINTFSLPGIKKAEPFKNYSGLSLAAPGPPGLIGDVFSGVFREYLVDTDRTPVFTKRMERSVPDPVLDLAYNGTEGLWLVLTRKKGLGFKAGDPESVAAEKLIREALDMIQAGFVEAGTDSLIAALAAAPEGGRKIVTASLMFRTLKKVPAQFRARVLADHAARMVSLDTEPCLNAALKRFVEYGMLAAEAGHPQMVGAAAGRVEALRQDMAGRLDTELAEDAVVVLTALQKVMTLGSDQAYKYMLTHGGPGEFAKELFMTYPDQLYPLFKDAKKLAYLLKTPVENLPAPDTGPRAPQPFTDLEGFPVDPSQATGAGPSLDAGKPAGTLLD